MFSMLVSHHTPSENSRGRTPRRTHQDNTNVEELPFPHCATAPLLVFVEDEKRVAQLLQVFVLQLLSDQRQRHLVVNTFGSRIEGSISSDSVSQFHTNLNHYTCGCESTNYVQ